MNKEDIMIRATRFTPTNTKVLQEKFEDYGLVGVYNRGLSDMYDYLMAINMIDKYGYEVSASDLKEH